MGDLKRDGPGSQRAPLMKYDADEIRKVIPILTENQPYEVRVIYSNGKVFSGYFKGPETLIKELNNINLDDCNVYITLNRIHEGCYCRKQRDRFIENRKGIPNTSENDVTAFRWLLIDLDPIRPSGISSTDEELKHSMKLALKVIEFMASLDLSNDYIIALSGNGIHILYKIDLPATEENKQILAYCLKSVDAKCSDAIVKIDAVNFKKSQVCKLYGTLAQKGSNTAERPFRMSRIITEDELKAGVKND